MRRIYFVPLLLLAGLVLACDSSTGPHILPYLVITPRTLPTMTQNESFALTLSIAPSEVDWSSSDATVASVSPDGVVTGHSVGEAWITAVWKVDTRSRDSVQVNVVASGVTEVPPPFAGLAVYYHGTTNPVIPRIGIQGKIDVVHYYDIPPGPTFENLKSRITANGSVACETPLPDRQGKLTCTIDTAEKLNGQSTYPNGSLQIRQQIVRPDGVVIASATYQPLTISN